MYAAVAWTISTADPVELAAIVADVHTAFAGLKSCDVGTAAALVAVRSMANWHTVDDNLQGVEQVHAGVFEYVMFAHTDGEIFVTDMAFDPVAARAITR